MKRPISTKRPTTYNEIVARAHVVHAGRLAELKRAERHIRAIEADLKALDARGIFFAIDNLSMRLEDCSDRPSGQDRAQWALRIGTGALDSTGDRAIEALLSLGWILSRVRPRYRYANVVLRRPKTQLRLLLDGSESLIQRLQPQQEA